MKMPMTDKWWKHLCTKWPSSSSFMYSCPLPPSLCLPPPQLAGAGILAVGIWVKVDNSIMSILQGLAGAPPEIKQVLNVGYLLIAVGSVLLLLGFLGCCGAVRESRCMLLTVGLLPRLQQSTQSWNIILKTCYHSQLWREWNDYKPLNCSLWPVRSTTENFHIITLSEQRALWRAFLFVHHMGEPFNSVLYCTTEYFPIVEELQSWETIQNAFEEHFFS